MVPGIDDATEIKTLQWILIPTKNVLINRLMIFEISKTLEHKNSSVKNIISVYLLRKQIPYLGQIYIKF